MLERMRRQLAPPVFPDNDTKTRAARDLNAILIAIWLVLIIGVVATLLLAPDKTLGLSIVGILAVVQVAVWAMMKSGRVRAAGTLMSLTVWLILTGAVFAYGGLFSPSIGLTMLVILIAGVLLGTRGAIVFAALTMLSLTGLLALEGSSVLPKPTTTAGDLWANLLISSIMAAVLLSLATRGLQEALFKVRASARAQEQSLRELQAIRESLEERVNQRTTQLQVSAEVSRAVTSILEPRPLMRQVVQLIAERFNLYYAAIFLTDDDYRFAVLQEATGEAGRALLDRGHKLDIAGQSMVGESISTRRPHIAQDVDKETLRFANPLLTETKSEAALPLVVGGRAIGALDVQSTRYSAFDEGTLTVLQGLADQVAIAINNARQFQLAQADARQAAALFEASQATGALGEDLTLAVNRLFGVVAQRSDFDTWLAADFDLEHHTYHILTAFDANEPAPIEDVGLVVNIDRSLATPAALAIRAKQTVIINDPISDPRLNELEPDFRATLGKVISVPALIGERVVGVITLGRTPDKPNINPRDVQLGQAIASQLALTIENTRLFERTRAAAVELNQLMRLYTREGWSDYTVARGGAAVQEYLRPDARPLDPELTPRVEEAVLQRPLQPIGVDGQAVVGVPITLRGEVLGTLAVQDETDRQWTPDELATLQAVADQVAQSIEAARLLEESETNLLETSTLYEVSRAVSGAANLSEALNLFVATMQRRLQVDQVVLILFDDEHNHGTIMAEFIPTPQAAEIRLPMRGNSIYETLTRELRTIDVYDVEHAPITADNLPLLRARGVKSVLLVPILIGQKLIGSFGIDSRQQRRFTPAEIAFCDTLARQAASTIERYQLFEQTQTSLEETRALYQASRSIAAAQTPSEILQAISENVAAPHIDRVTLALIDPDSPTANPAIEVVAAWERNVDQSPVLNRRWSASQIPLILRHFTEPVAMGHVSESSEVDPISRHIFANIIGIKAMTIVPLLIAGRSIGWVTIEALSRPVTWTEQELRRYRTLAGQATVALENRRLFQDVEARVNELTALTRIGRRLASTLELEQVLALIVDEVLGVTPAMQASIALYNDEARALEMRFMRGYAPHVERQMAGSIIRANDGLHGRVLTTGHVVLVNDTAMDPDYRPINAGTRSELIVPIRQGDLLLGALNLESPQVHAFRESDVHLIEAMADQVAVAISNARAYEAERQAVERIREADRLKTQFLANMSHELRTPLNSIIGFSRVILRGIDGPLTELQTTDLTAIYNSGQHLLSLINNILDLSKIEAGKMELAIEPVSLLEIAKSVMSTAIALVKDRPVRLEQDVPADLPTVMADQTRVRQIMLNLVSNAAKFTEQGAVTLRVWAGPRDVYVSVHDTGIGIPANKLDHIFEEFTQVDASTTRRYGGTGLGLAITRRFVEMHNGRIWVESVEGAGSTFTFTLPREQPSDEPETPIGLPTDLEARGEGKKLILCIDDDPGVITLYKRYLEKQGYAVIGLTDSTKAVEEAKRLLPFAITLDVLMPNRDGWQVLADLKKEPEIAHTPIVVCSILQDKSKGYTLGAADYLVKPITEDELLRALERMNRDKGIHKVLVIDDEPEAINLIHRLLEAETGYEVIDASGGAAGLAIVQNERPDLVILDLMMPDIDGFAVLDNLKGSALTRHIPVIVVTAKEITEDDRERLQGKAAALLNKGMFTAEQLLQDIVQTLAAMEGVKVEQVA